MADQDRPRHDDGEPPPEHPRGPGVDRSSGWPSDPRPSQSRGWLTGQSFGGYTLHESLGSGAFGEVYRASRDARQRQWAIKVLPSGVGLGEGVLHEALEHPNIVRVDDLGTFEDPAGQRRAYIAMELLGPDCTLASYVRRHRAAGACRPHDVLTLVIDACRGVAYAHDRGVQHYDLKPDNILVDVARAGRPIAKVADFGLAGLRLDAGWHHAGGSLAYQSPEQCTSPAGGLTFASDVYALGVTLFHLLSDQYPVPLGGTSTAEEAYRIKVTSPPRLELLGDAPPDLRRVIARALAPMPEDRYKNAGELADALEPVAQRLHPKAGGLAGELAAAGSPLAHRAARFARVRPRRSAFAVGLACSLLAAWLLASPVRVLGGAYGLESAVLSLLGPGARPMVSAAGGVFGPVRMVELPRDAADVADLAAHLELENVLAGVKPTWRSVHAAMIDAAAAAGARAVVLDIYFPTPAGEHDMALAAAIERANAKGMPVVVGSASWQVDDAGRPGMPETIWESGVRFGALSIDHAGERLFTPLAAGVPGERAIAGLALQAAVAAIRPQAQASASVLEADHPDAGGAPAVRVRWWTPASRPGERRWVGQPLILPATALTSVGDLGARFRHGRSPTWKIALHEPPRPGHEAIAQATLGLDHFLRAGAAERRELAAGRVLVVIDPEGDNPVGELAGERTLLGGHMHAAAIASLLSGQTTRWWGGGGAMAASALAAVCGACLGAVLVGRRGPGGRGVVGLAGGVGAGAALAVGISLAGMWAAAAWAGVVVSPTVVLLAAVLSVALAALSARGLLLGGAPRARAG